MHVQTKDKAANVLLAHARQTYAEVKGNAPKLTHLPLEVSGVPDLPQELAKALNQDRFAGHVV